MSQLTFIQPRRAIATVELALCLPLLLIFLLGVWEIARYIEVQQVLNNAAREAGRQAAGGGKTTTQVTQSVVSFLRSASIDPSNIEVSIANLDSPGLSDPTQANYLDRLAIVIRLPYRNVSLSLTSMFIPTSARMTASATWRSLRDLPVSVDTRPPVE
jgi:Flp pilus assembly protein TadG